ncbi:tellurite resistance TerB family protein [uncultured Roseobacter sp.]|uniref:tellurite resistance TerB family protein n=1 Tax=uncultured Roseobacter sp. TaxID=114847 RepID=UPI00260C77EF|nr:tellurite resistance TerB family protein [uncultured Roseobacter sp.]
MSLMKTLAKVAIGVAVAKGAQSMMKGGGGGLGGMVRDAAGRAGSGRSFGGQHSAGGGSDLQDMLGGLLGGKSGARSAGGMPGGLGGLLEGLAGGKGGGLQDMLSGLAGGAGAGGLLGALAGQAQRRPQTSKGSFGEVLNSSFDATPEPEIEPSADQEAAAALMLRAMIQAAKSDGKLDDAEREKLLGQLGDDVDAEEAAFVQKELGAPVDVDGLVAQVPRGMEQQVYAVSVLGINLDNQSEAEYLHKLAKGLGLDAQSVNGIHDQLGVPSLYT